MPCGKCYGCQHYSGTGCEYEQSDYWRFRACMLGERESKETRKELTGDAGSKTD